MTPHERELILGVADQVRAADRSAIDPEAEQLIRAEVASQRNAAYLLTQRVIVQELALRQAQARIDELEGRTRPGGGGSGRSFLGGADRPAEAPAGPQSAGAAPPPAGGGGVGSFLKTAAAAAAGTIGGQLIYDGVRHLAAGHWGGPGGSGLLGETVSGGFLPGGPGPDVPDYSLESADQGRNWGGGGDFGSEQADAAEADDYQADEDDEDETGDADEWDDDSADSGDSGGGGDW